MVDYVPFDILIVAENSAALFSRLLSMVETVEI
jgi:hypothetical protein